MATMSNAEIILNARFDLLEAGIIRATGRKLEVITGDGERSLIDEPEELHTFQAWKKIGYSVKKGEKAVARLRIWNHTGPKTITIPMQDGTEQEMKDSGHYYTKESCFFAAHQVERIKN